MIAKKKEIPVKSFKTAKEWQRWLAKNHSASDGIWIQLFKKSSGIKSINYMEALDEALCYGWIDGQKKGYDEQSWLQKFTPRRPGSIWSKKNIEHISRLTEEGRMQPSGLLQAKEAKEDGRWEKAYDSPSTMQVPEDFMNQLSKNKTALAFFKTLNKANTYAIAWRLQTAKKPETREKRMEVLLEMMRKKKKIHG